MGRFAQARRRGGGGGAPPAPAAGVSLIAASDIGGGDMVLTFDGPATVDVGNIPDLGAFTLDGTPPNVVSAANSLPDTITISQTIDPSSGAVAAWASQPPWITEAVNLASTAVVS